MRYGVLMLAAAGLWSSQVSAGELQSVYVAPGGVYIASARVYVAPGLGNGDPPYVAPGAAYGGPGYGGPGYGPRGPAYRAHAYYEALGPAYAPPPVYIEPETVYPSAYAAEYVPRPPAAIPYNGGVVASSTSAMAAGDTAIEASLHDGKKDGSGMSPPNLVKAIILCRTSLGPRLPHPAPGTARNALRIR
jgi:hypothetical protein